MFLALPLLGRFLFKLDPQRSQTGFLDQPCITFLFLDITHDQQKIITSVITGIHHTKVGSYREVYHSASFKKGK